MGVFRYSVGIASSPQGPFEVLEALVDTGATYTWIPSDVLRRLDIQPVERRSFVLADGRQAEYEMGEVRLRIDDREFYSPCIFGDEGTDLLLGAVTLEGFGLAVDPVNKTLMRVPGYLLSTREPS